MEKFDIQKMKVNDLNKDALINFLLLFVNSVYVVVNSDSGDQEVMEEKRVMNYAKHILLANQDDENLPDRFQQLFEAGYIEHLGDAIDLIRWAGDEIFKLEA